MELVCCIKETKKFITANSDVIFDRTKQPRKYDKIEIRLLGIRGEIPFKRYLINRMKLHLCLNRLSL